MVFAPRFQEASDSLIIDNVLAIVKRDFKSALDYFYPLVAAGTPRLDDSIARAVGITVLHMDGFTAKPAEGDLFTIAGDAQVYEVVSSTALVGTDSDVTFRPGLKVAIPAVDGNEVVTFSGQLDFAQRTLGEFITLAYPSFAISPKSNGPEQSADGSYVDETLKLNMLVGVESSDAPTATRKATKYIRALKAILRTATIADYTTGFPANSIFALNVELSYEYGLISANAQGFVKIAHIELVLKFNER